MTAAMVAAASAAAVHCPADPGARPLTGFPAGQGSWLEVLHSNGTSSNSGRVRSSSSISISVSSGHHRRESVRKPRKVHFTSAGLLPPPSAVRACAPVQRSRPFCGPTPPLPTVAARPSPQIGRLLLLQLSLSPPLLPLMVQMKRQPHPPMARDYLPGQTSTTSELGEKPHLPSGENPLPSSGEKPHPSSGDDPLPSSGEDPLPSSSESANRISALMEASNGTAAEVDAADCCGNGASEAAGAASAEAAEAVAAAEAAASAAAAGAAGRFSGVVVGGTFDRLHGGHKLLLSTAMVACKHIYVTGDAAAASAAAAAPPPPPPAAAAAAAAAAVAPPAAIAGNTAAQERGAPVVPCGLPRLVVGISTGALLQHKYLSELIQPYSVRKAAVNSFLQREATRQGKVLPDGAPAVAIHCVPISVGAPTEGATDPGLQCIVVTDETVGGARRLNELRIANGLQPMQILVAPTLLVPSEPLPSSLASLPSSLSPSSPPTSSTSACLPPSFANGVRTIGEAAASPQQQQQPKLSSSDLRKEALGTFLPLPSLPQQLSAQKQPSMPSSQHVSVQGQQLQERQEQQGQQRGRAKEEEEDDRVNDDAMRDAEQDDGEATLALLSKRRLQRRVRGPQSTPPFSLGLTGGIACGKSTVGQQLRALGAGVVDCDRLAHRAYERGTPSHRKLVHTFGTEILNTDRSINRAALGQRVFGSPSEMKKLTDIVWPAVRSLVEEEREHRAAQWAVASAAALAAASTVASAVPPPTEEAEVGRNRRSEDQAETQQQQQHLGDLSANTVPPPVVVFEAAMMLEAGSHASMDEVWVVFAPTDVAKQRLMSRNDLSEEEAMKRISAQMTTRRRLSFADVALFNGGSRDDLCLQTSKAWHLLQQRLQKQVYKWRADVECHCRHPGLWLRWTSLLTALGVSDADVASEWFGVLFPMIPPAARPAAAATATAATAAVTETTANAAKATAMAAVAMEKEPGEADAAEAAALNCIEVREACAADVAWRWMEEFHSVAHLAEDAQALKLAAFFAAPEMAAALTPPAAAAAVAAAAAADAPAVAHAQAEEPRASPGSDDACGRDFRSSTSLETSGKERKQQQQQQQQEQHWQQALEETSEVWRSGALSAFPSSRFLLDGCLRRLRQFGACAQLSQTTVSACERIIVNNATMVTTPATRAGWESAENDPQLFLYILEKTIGNDDRQ